MTTIPDSEDCAQTERPKIGDLVWYVLGNDIRAQAEIVEIDGETQATVRMLTNPQKGQLINAPWGVIEPLTKPKG
jgi:hypothetical protein